jgi:hypothetical protein
MFMAPPSDLAPPPPLKLIGAIFYLLQREKEEEDIGLWYLVFQSSFLKEIKFIVKTNQKVTWKSPFNPLSYFCCILMKKSH